ncbi:MAG: transketolase [Candidatus Aenigmatarchaeota archaeon]
MFSKEKELKVIAKEIRKHIIKMTTCAKSGHPGGSLSAADIITALYFYKMRYRPDEPNWNERDRFILSKGHACPVLYAALAIAGFFLADELMTSRKINSRIQGHPSMILPGIDACSGSLGQGLSVANGIALSARIDKKDYNVYILLGDGELQEGQIWEAAMTSSQYKINNLTAIVDRNGLQIDGNTEDVKGLNPLAEKWRSFGWHVIEIDGHDFPQLLYALDMKSDRPKVIIANTIKGKGVCSMENNIEFHGKVLCDEECQRAMKELESQ